MKISDIKIDCRYFKGHIPCKPSKDYGVHCVDEKGIDCKYYQPVKEKILIIKLGAIGDVIRTTPLLEAIKSDYPKAKIFWLTYSPEVVPGSVDEVLKFNQEGITFLESVQFDIIYNLDKDKEACALTNKLISKVKKGYILKDGVPFPADKAAEQKFFTGLFDDVNQANTKNYLEEIFDICGFRYSGQKYILSSFEKFSESWDLNKSKKIIGLNTGCGGRWTSRLWADENWINLANSLIKKNCEIVFLGGSQEDEKNKMFAEKTGGKYFGHFPLEKFINLVNQCQLIVTGVTMAMHITLGLNKKIVLFNNIFNPNEFELFGLGKILQPEKECKCFFRGTCINPDYKCMDYLKTDTVLQTIEHLLT
jgi:lipopolysaccharide heptosyltransferase III